jgi:hypothetical protein
MGRNMSEARRDENLFDCLARKRKALEAKRSAASFAEHLAKPEDNPPFVGTLDQKFLLPIL